MAVDVAVVVDVAVAVVVAVVVDVAADVVRWREEGERTVAGGLG